jgi:hypothetical protein
MFCCMDCFDDNAPNRLRVCCFEITVFLQTQIWQASFLVIHHRSTSCTSFSLSTNSNGLATVKEVYRLLIEKDFRRSVGLIDRLPGANLPFTSTNQFLASSPVRNHFPYFLEHAMVALRSIDAKFHQCAERKLIRLPSTTSGGS